MSNTIVSDVSEILRQDHNSTDSNPVHFSRRDYNKRYYEMHKERLQEKKKSRSRTNVLQIFARIASGNIKIEKSSWTFLRYVELMALIGMAFVMTYFLVREAAAFYLDAQEGTVSAYLKAGMVEGVAILFSFSRGKSSVLRWSQRVVVVLLCGLTLWTMSGKILSSAVQDSSRTRAVMQMISDLESEESQKARFHEVMIQKEWIGSARRYEKGLDLIRQKLTSARRELATLQSPNVIMNSLGILIAFRLLVVVANLISIHRVVECFSDESVQKVNNPSSN